MDSHGEPPVNGQRKRKLLSTNSDAGPSQVLTEPTKSSKKEKLPVQSRRSSKTSRKLSDKFDDSKDASKCKNTDKSDIQCGDNRPKEDNVLKTGGKAPIGGKGTRKRKKDDLSSETSEEETRKSAKKRKGEKFK